MSEHTAVRQSFPHTQRKAPRGVAHRQRVEKQRQVAAINDILPYLVDCVCGELAVSKEQLYSKQQFRRVTRARFVVWWILRNHPHTFASYPSIGAPFKRDHTTIMAGVRVIDWAVQQQRECDLPALVLMQRICDRLARKGFAPMKIPGAAHAKY